MAEQSEIFLVEELCKQAMEDGKIKMEKLSSVRKMTGDASTRRYFRVFSETENYVACLATPGEDAFATMKEVLQAADVRVPKLYDVSVNRGFFLEEDLGDVTFLKMLSNKRHESEQFDYYIKAIDQMINIHKIDIAAHPNAPFATLFFDEVKLMQEVRMTLDYFLGAYLKCEDALAIREIEKLFRDIVTQIAKLPRVVCHRDFHSRNIMMKNEELIIIDFQDARQGPRQYDLASLIDDCYFKLGADAKDRLKKYYYEQAGLTGDYQQFLYQYDLVAIQRLFKAIGSFSYIYESRKDVRYLKYIGYAFENLRIKLMGLSDYAERAIVLSDIYYAS